MGNEVQAVAPMGTALTRRGLLVGAAVGLGVLAVEPGAVHGAMADEVGSDAIKWDVETDILMAGSGMSLFGALAAHMKGENVLVIEKRGVLGGTAALSGGKVWVPMNTLMEENFGPDDREGAIAYIKRIGEGMAPDDLIEGFVDGSKEFFDWSYNELGFPWACYPNPQTPWEVYQDDGEGFHRGRVLLAADYLYEAENPQGYDAWPGGPAIFHWLIPKAEELGLPTMVNTAAKKLICNEMGEVIGVEAEKDGQTLRIKANKAVILATGGYDRDPEMMKTYQRVKPCGSIAVEANTGDAVKMGREVGAALAQMQSNWGCPWWLPMDWDISPDAQMDFDFKRFDTRIERGRPHSIIVDSHGVRFCDESANYHTINRTFEAWCAGGASMGRPIPGYLIVDAQFMEHYPLPLAEGEIGRVPDDAVQADTLEELAKKIGIDYDNLSWQVEQFNRFAEQGHDPQFHRGESFWDDKITTYTGVVAEPDLPNPVLGTVEKPPFVAVAMYPGTLGTKGGLKTNGRAQVLNEQGEVIPRLYASGGAANTPLGESYPAAGGVLGSCAVMGYVAAMAACEETLLEA